MNSNIFSICVISLFTKGNRFINGKKLSSLFSGILFVLPSLGQNFPGFQGWKVYDNDSVLEVQQHLIVSSSSSGVFFVPQKSDSLFIIAGNYDSREYLPASSYKVYKMNSYIPYLNTCSPFYVSREWLDSVHTNLDDYHKYVVIKYNLAWDNIINKTSADSIMIISQIDPINRDLGLGKYSYIKNKNAVVFGKLILYKHALNSCRNRSNQSPDFYLDSNMNYLIYDIANLSPGLYDNTEMDSLAIEFVSPGDVCNYPGCRGKDNTAVYPWIKEELSTLNPLHTICDSGAFPCAPNEALQIPKGFTIKDKTKDLIFSPDFNLIKRDYFGFSPTWLVSEFRTDSTGAMVKISSSNFSVNAYFILMHFNRSWPLIYRKTLFNNSPRLAAKHYEWHACATDTMQVLIPTTVSQRPDLPERFDNVLWWNNSIPDADFRYRDSSVKEKTGVFTWVPGIGNIHNQPYRFTAYATAADTCHCYQVNSRTFLVYVHQKPTATRQYDSFTCGGFNARALDTLSARLPGPWQYHWKLQSLDGSTTYHEQSGKQVRLQAPISGRYRVELITRGPDNTACPARYLDTVEIERFVAVSLPKDTAYCEGTIITLQSSTLEGKPVRYQWSTGDTTERIAFTLNQDMLIRLDIQDSAGCRNDAQIFIKAHALPRFTLPQDTLLCPGIVQNIQLPALPKNTASFLWNQNNSDSILRTQAPALIALEVRDSNSCTFNDTLQLFAPGTEGYRLSLPDTACRFGVLTPGTLVASGHANQSSRFIINGVNRASWPAPFVLIQDSLTVQWINTFDSASATGCTYSIVKKVYTAEQPRFSINPIADTLCSNLLPLALSTTPAPQSGIILHWNTADSTNILNQSPQTPEERFSPRLTILATATSRHGCQWRDSLRTSIAWMDQLSLTSNPAAPIQICKGESISLQASSLQNKNILWEIDENLFTQTGTGNTRTLTAKSGTPEGAQSSITIKTAATRHCPEGSATQSVQIYSYPKAEIQGINPEACEPYMLNLQSATDTAQSYQWWQNNELKGTQSTYSTTLNRGTYNIRLITQGTHCSDTAEQSIQIHERPEIGIQIRPGTEVYIDKPEVNLKALFPRSGKAEDHTLNWNLGDGTQKQGAEISHRYTDTGSFAIVLSATNARNCTAEDTIYLKVWPKAFFLMPTAFSPNNDGINDRFLPQGNGIASWSMDIYTRWGQRVYSGTEQDGGWDGMYLNKPAQIGTYTYILKVTLATGEEFEEQGRVAMLR